MDFEFDPKTGLWLPRKLIGPATTFASEAFNTPWGPMMFPGPNTLFEPAKLKTVMFGKPLEFNIEAGELFHIQLPALEFNAFKDKMAAKMEAKIMADCHLPAGLIAGSPCYHAHLRPESEPTSEIQRSPEWSRAADLLGLAYPGHGNSILKLRAKIAEKELPDWITHGRRAIAERASAAHELWVYRVAQVANRHKLGLRF